MMPNLPEGQPVKGTFQDFESFQKAFDADNFCFNVLSNIAFTHRKQSTLSSLYVGICPDRTAVAMFTKIDTNSGFYLEIRYSVDLQNGDSGFVRIKDDFVFRMDSFIDAEAILNVVEDFFNCPGTPSTRIRWLNDFETEGCADEDVVPNHPALQQYIDENPHLTDL
jgi:hypothetical protein